MVSQLSNGSTWATKAKNGNISAKVEELDKTIIKLGEKVFIKSSELLKLYEREEKLKLFLEPLS